MTTRDRYFTAVRIGDAKIALQSPMTIDEIADMVADDHLAPNMRFFEVRPAGARTARVIEIHPDADEAEYLDRL